MKKRGQVTGFFIAGAIILVLVLGFFGVKYMVDNDVLGLGLQKKEKYLIRLNRCKNSSIVV